jgi:hypothetical protein
LRGAKEERGRASERASERTIEEVLEAAAHGDEGDGDGHHNEHLDDLGDPLQVRLGLADDLRQGNLNAQPTINERKNVRVSYRRQKQCVCVRERELYGGDAALVGGLLERWRWASLRDSEHDEEGP